MGLLLVGAMLFGCQPGLNKKQRAEVVDIAADQAPEDHSARISDLEDRISELESRLGY